MTTTKTFLILAILGYLSGLYGCRESRKEPDSKYELRDPITDLADILTTEQEDSLIVIMEQLELKVGSQLAILTIPTLNGEEIEAFSFKTAEASGLGRAKYNDGVLITIAYEDRKVRIEVKFPWVMMTWELGEDAPVKELINKEDWQFSSFNYEEGYASRQLDAYTQTTKNYGDTIELEIRGVDNGMHMDYEFANEKGKWFMVSGKDYSN